MSRLEAVILTSHDCFPILGGREGFAEVGEKSVGAVSQEPARAEWFLFGFFGGVACGLFFLWGGGCGGGGVQKKKQVLLGVSGPRPAKTKNRSFWPSGSGFWVGCLSPKRA